MKHGEGRTDTSIRVLHYTLCGTQGFYLPNAPCAATGYDEIFQYHAALYIIALSLSTFSYRADTF